MSGEEVVSKEEKENLVLEMKARDYIWWDKFLEENGIYEISTEGDNWLTGAHGETMPWTQSPACPPDKYTKAMMEISSPSFRSYGGLSSEEHTKRIEEFYKANPEKPIISIFPKFGEEFPPIFTPSEHKEEVDRKQKWIEYFYKNLTPEEVKKQQVIMQFRTLSFKDLMEGSDVKSQNALWDERWYPRKKDDYITVSETPLVSDRSTYKGKNKWKIDPYSIYERFGMPSKSFEEFRHIFSGGGGGPVFGKEEEETYNRRNPQDVGRGSYWEKEKIFKTAWANPPGGYWRGIPSSGWRPIRRRDDLYDNPSKPPPHFKGNYSDFLHRLSPDAKGALIERFGIPSSTYLEYEAQAKDNEDEIGFSGLAL